jgi:hypothetical protein
MRHMLAHITKFLSRSALGGAGPWSDRGGAELRADMMVGTTPKQTMIATSACSKTVRFIEDEPDHGVQGDVAGIPIDVDGCGPGLFATRDLDCVFAWRLLRASEDAACVSVTRLAANFETQVLDAHAVEREFGR